MKNRRIRLRNRPTHQRVIARPVIPGRLRVRIQRRLRDLRHQPNLADQMRRRRARHALRPMDAPGAVLHRHRLRTARLNIHLDPPQHRQNITDLTRHDLAAVQLRRHIHRQPHFPPSRLHPPPVRNRPQKIAPQHHERLDLPGQNRLASLNRVHPRLLRRLEPVLRPQPIHRNRPRLLRDPDRSLPLHVGMPPHRTNSRPGLADIAPHQQQIRHHLHRRHTRPVLRQPHPIDRDRSPRPGIHGRRRFQRRPRKPRAPLQRLPLLRLQPRHERIESLRFRVNERPIDRPQRQHRLADPRQRSQVAASHHLVILRSDPRLLPRQHLRRRLRIDKPLQPPLPQRVIRNDRHPSLRRCLQRMQHPRRIAPRVLPEKQNTIRLRKILERYTPDRLPNTLRQRHRSRLMTHVRTVRQVVVAIQPRKQPIQIAGFVRTPPRTIEYRVPAILHGPQLPPDLLDRRPPGHRHIPVRCPVIPHRMRQPPGLLQTIVIPPQQLRHRMRRKEIRRAAMRCDLPSRRLRPVLAKLQRQWRRRLHPGATHALKPVHLVLPPQRQGAAAQHPLLRQNRAH